MLNSTVLDVGIGLIFVYLVLGIMCTAVNEWIAQFFDMRAQMLKQAIHQLLGAVASDLPGLFRPEDLHVAKLVRRLTAPGNKLAATLGLDPSNNPGEAPLSDSDLSAIGQALAARLNAALDSTALYAAIDTSRVSAPTLAAAEKASDSRRRAANHDLLCEAYPDELGGLIRCFYDHPLIRSLTQPGGHPSYVPSRIFAAVLTDILGNSVAGPSRLPWDVITSSIANLPPCDAKRVLQKLAQISQEDLDVFQKNLETWFDDSMDRVSGWYKKKVQIITVAIATGITIFANADTVQIARKLFLNPTVRQKIVQEAASKSSKETPAILTAEEKADIGELTGWSAEFITFHDLKQKQAGASTASPSDAFPGLELLQYPQVLGVWLWWVVPAHLLGWFLTASAVSLGAPFWFDILNRFMNIRSAGTAPNEKGSDRSKA